MPKPSELQISPTAKPSAHEERLRKSVGAIHSSGKLTLVQRKLANVLLYAAYDDLLKTDTHTIPVSIMCSMLGWDASNRIEYLKEALGALQETRLEFNLHEDGAETWESMTMLSYAKIKNGLCTYRYDKALAERLFDPAMFAMINLGVQRRLDSAYALNLYENVYRFKNANSGSTGWWELPFFREIIGATATYLDDFRQLNAKVIKPALAKINEVSDVIVTMDKPKREGRSVAALRFFVREKTDAEKQAMPIALPGMSFTESVDEYQELRQTEAFQLLRKHAIPERLAFQWIREKGEQAVIDLVRYTEERDAKNLISTNTRAYMTSLVKVGADVGESEYDREKAAKTRATTKKAKAEASVQRLASLESEFRTECLRLARNALTLEERAAHANAWLATEEGRGRAADYDPTKGRFMNPVNNIQFEQVYLPTVLSVPIDQAAFVHWIKEAKRLDPTTLGLTG